MDDAVVATGPRAMEAVKSDSKGQQLLLLLLLFSFESPCTSKIVDGRTLLFVSHPLFLITAANFLQEKCPDSETGRCKTLDHWTGTLPVVHFCTKRVVLCRRTPMKVIQHVEEQILLIYNATSHRFCWLLLCITCSLKLTSLPLSLIHI